MAGWYSRCMASSEGTLAGAGPWYRVLALPDVVFGGTPERDYAAVLPAVLNAAQAGRPFVVGWLSRGGGAQLELITNAGPLPRPPGPVVAGPVVAGPGPERGELLFPWGSQGARTDGDLVADLGDLVWAPCPGRQAPQLLGVPATSGGRQGAAPWEAGEPGVPGVGGFGGFGGFGGSRPSLFESALTTLMQRPFGWLVVAEQTDLIDAETADLRSVLNSVRRFDEERSRFDVERAVKRLAELDNFREAGLWRVRVLVGASDAEQLRVVAPMLVGSADLSAHQYRLRGPGKALSLDEALAAEVVDPADGSAVPFAATASVLGALAGLPRREVPGLRLLDVGYFDVTVERPAGPAITAGTVLDGQDRAVGTLSVPLATLNRHAFVTGATGAGKSQTVRHLLTQLTAAGLPWLVIEPVKSEYSAMAGRLAGTGAELTIINPADPAAIPLAVNPLAPEPGYPVQAHIDMLRALFLAAFEAHEPFPQIMSQALQRVYESCGWDTVTGGGAEGSPPPSVPTLAQLRQAALEVIADVGYGRELQADVRGFVDVRLRSLRTGSAGRFFEGGHPADLKSLLGRNVVLAIEDVANDEDKAFLIGTLIIRITEHLRLRARSGRAAEPALTHVIVIEEAHRLLRAGREGAAGHAVELFAGMLAEIRAYGEGLIIAEQIPAKLIPDVVKNTALKIVHRLPAKDDRELVGATMNLDAEQSRQVVAFPPGMAAVFADGMDRPVRIQVPFGGAAELADGGDRLTGPPLAGRRSAACGDACTGERACTLLELRAADRLADAPEDAWLRVWVQALALAFLTNSPVPVAPLALRQRWASQPARLRDCLLATVIERAVGSRASAIRAYFDPRDLITAVARIAARLLEGGKGAGTQAGVTWVIPQLRWLHELERALPLNGPSYDPFELALPLQFELPGIPDTPDLKVGQRVGALRRHPLSMELDRNRLPAWTALLGEDDQAGFTRDLASLAVGSSHRGQLLQAAGEMGVVGWLEPVLSWPRRFIVGGDERLAGGGGPAAIPAPNGLAGSGGPSRAGGAGAARSGPGAG